MSESDGIFNYLQLVLKNENFVEYDIKTPGKTGKGDGYLGKITFVTVTGKKKNGEIKILELILKTPSSNKIARQNIAVREVFLKEIYIYDKVVPAFKYFLKEISTKNELLDFLPHCHLTGSSEGQEFIILENLKSRGFDSCDRLKPMPYNYIKKTLETCAQWHAFSFAMKHKKPETFKKLVEENNLNMWPYHIAKMGITDVIFEYFDEVRNICKSDVEITNKLNLTKKDTEYTFTDLFLEDPDHHVIIHDDCWTNNLMFKLDCDTQAPVDVRFIDWQLSAITSPVMDLSYLIYTCVDTEIYNNVKDLLKIYYESLSICLLQLGCDSGQLFPYETLVKHWQRFSRFGILLGTLILKFSLANADEAPDLTESVGSGKDFLDNFQFSIANQDLYHRRVKNNFLHYIRNLQFLD